MGSRNAKRQEGHSIARSQLEKVQYNEPELLSKTQCSAGPGTYIRGPIPLEWLKAAAALPGKSLHIGLALWLLAEIEKSRTIALSNAQASYFSIDRNAKYRALDWLETAGLIEIKRKLGQSPIVTLIENRSSNDST